MKITSQLLWQGIEPTYFLSFKDKDNCKKSLRLCYLHFQATPALS